MTDHLELVKRLEYRAKWLNTRSFADFSTTAALLREAADALRAAPVTATVSPIREGDENDGKLESTDLFVRGRGIALLCNVTAGQAFTYSLIVDGAPQASGWVGEQPADSAGGPEPGRGAWLPIEAHDGTGHEVLLWWPYWSLRPTIGYLKFGKWIAENALIDGNECPGPTHFMPLPAPPADATRTEG